MPGRAGHRGRGPLRRLEDRRALVYRQSTMATLVAGMLGLPRDVRTAWRRYLAHDNHERDVVLNGPSQGPSS